jgi:hypothetical protein
MDHYFVSHSWPADPTQSQWRTRGGGFKPPPKFRSFENAQPNSQFRGKYIRNCLVFLLHHPN